MRIATVRVDFKANLAVYLDLTSRNRWYFIRLSIDPSGIDILLMAGDGKDGEAVRDGKAAASRRIPKWES